MPITEAKISTVFIEKLTASLPLLSPRLCLRLPNPEDAAWIEPAVGNPRVALMTGSIPHPYPAGGARDYIQNKKANFDQGTELSLVIERGQDRIPMGVIGLRFDSSQSEIGYWLAEEFWGQGYASEAAARVLAFMTALGSLLTSSTFTVRKRMISSDSFSWFSMSATAAPGMERPRWV